MNNSIALHPEQLSEMCRKADGLPYALQLILKKSLQKISSYSINSFYGSDYNDCHGDYYDADYN